MIENDLKEIIMNKIFFAKYLPIEGEIKKDDNALNPSNKKVVRVNAACLKNLVTLEWKKVKLFLCSRDIQVGDKFIHPNDLSKTFTATEDTIDWHSTIDTFKVIGEISPKDVWVKEGMEFDEKEIQRHMGKIYGTDEPYKLKADIIIKIQCPTCKTYH